MIGKERRQIAILRIQQPLDAPLRDVLERGRRHCQKIKCEYERRAVEVSTRKYFTAAIRKDQGIIRRTVDFYTDDAAHIFDAFPHGAMNLGHASETVGVLNSCAIDVRLADLTVAKEVCEPR